MASAERESVFGSGGLPPMEFMGTTLVGGQGAFVPEADEI